MTHTPYIGSAFRQCLDLGDAARMWAIWGEVFPGHPQPVDIEAARVILHCARTETESIRMEARLYSHGWLKERGYRSRLPNELRPGWEGSTIVPAVGVAVACLSKRPDRKEEARALERVMARAAGDMVRAGITDRARIAPHMWQARDAFLDQKMRREI